MYQIFKSIGDQKPVAITDDFKEAVKQANFTFSIHPETNFVFIFLQADAAGMVSARKLAGIVSRTEVIELLFHPFLYMEVRYETIFSDTNVDFCHEPSVLSYCLKLLSFNNKIISIKPVTRKEFYDKLAKPLPF